MIAHNKLVVVVAAAVAAVNGGVGGGENVCKKMISSNLHF